MRDSKPGYPTAWKAMSWAHFVGFIVQFAIDRALTDALEPATLAALGAAFGMLTLVFAVGYGFRTTAAKAITFSLLMSLVLWLFGPGAFERAQDALGNEHATVAE